MRRHLLASALVVSALSSVSLAHAAGATASFLKIPVGARQVGMGQAFTAVANDANAAWWNPAGLGGLTRREISATDAQLFAGTRFDTLSYAQPVKRGALAVSIGYLSHDTIEGRDANRNKTGGFTASDMVVGLSFGRPAGNMQIGGTVKYVRSKIAEASATGVAADVGLLMPTRMPGLTVAAAVQNIGPGMKFVEERDPLPLTLTAGASYQTPMGVTVSAELKRQVHEKTTAFSAGMELPLFSAVTARAGYQRAQASSTGAAGSSSVLAGFGGGFGFKVFGYGVDYAFTPMGELGSAQRISLSAKF